MENSKISNCPTELSVGEVAARSGVAVSALHFYEAEGLISSWRNQGNQRRYAARSAASHCRDPGGTTSRNLACIDS